MKKKLLVSLLAVCTAGISYAQNVNIPDANFKSYLINNASINTNSDTEISVSEAESYTGAIIVANTGISDLTGIEAFKNITRLDCDQNSLTTLDVSNNLELTRLHCGNNQLTSLDVSLNTKMVEILCPNNNLTLLNIANGQNRNISNSYGYMKSYGNPDLACINVDPGFTITSTNGQYSHGWTKDATSNTSWHCIQPANYINIPDANFKNELLVLHDLDYNDEISEYEAAYITTLNVAEKGISDLTGVEYFTNLEELNVNNNSLTSIDLSNNSALVKLEASNNNIVSLSVPTTIEELTLNDNSISSIDVSAYTALKVLNLNGNSITSIDLSSNTQLTHLYIGQNELSVLDVSNNLQLVLIDCYNNQLTSIDVSANNALTRLHCAENNLTSLDVSNNPNLDEILCYANDLTLLNIANGNNAYINKNNGYMKAYNNLDLTCINVDAGLSASTYAQQGQYSLGWTKDGHATYSSTCDLTTAITNGSVIEHALEIYPNPTNSIINTPVGEIAIFDQLGSLVLSTTSNGQVDVSALSKGIYTVSQADKKAKLIIE